LANSGFRYTEDDTAPKPTATSEQVKSEPSPSAAAKTEEPADHNGDGDEKMYGGEEEDDDEIDFNLGGDSGGAEQTYDAPSHSHHDEAHGPGIKEDG